MPIGEIGRASGIDGRSQLLHRPKLSNSHRRRSTAQKERRVGFRANRRANLARHRFDAKTDERHSLRRQRHHRSRWLKATVRPHPARYPAHHCELCDVHARHALPVPLLSPLTPSTTRGRIRSAARTRPRSPPARSTSAKESHGHGGRARSHLERGIASDAMLRSPLLRPCAPQWYSGAYLTSELRPGSGHGELHYKETVCTNAAGNR